MIQKCRRYNIRLGYTNHTNKWGWSQLFRRWKQFLVCYWYPSCYSCYKSSDKSATTIGTYSWSFQIMLVTCIYLQNLLLRTEVVEAVRLQWRKQYLWILYSVVSLLWKNVNIYGNIYLLWSCIFWFLASLFWEIITDIIFIKTILILACW